MGETETTRDPMAWVESELAKLESHGLRRRLRERQQAQRAVVTVDGRELVNFSSNDYLGLAADRLNRAAIAGIRQTGWGSGASPLITGRGALHADLESRLARFEGTQSALLFSSGYAANAGTIASLVGKRDVIFSDAKNHASIIDGCRLSGARVEVYRHGDVTHLQQLLVNARHARRRLIVTDSLFSMDGDLAPLVELTELAEQHRAMLMVDEAHATGVFGDRGRGVAEHLGVEQRVHVRIGTLSKALGSSGGFVAGSRSLIQWLANRARSYVFSTAPPEAVAAAGMEAVRTVQEEPHRRNVLLENAGQLRSRLAAQGWNVGGSASQIIPVVVGEPDEAMRLHRELDQRGLFAPGIRPPSVPVGESLLRISLSYSHTQAMLDQLVQAMGELRGGRVC